MKVNLEGVSKEDVRKYLNSLVKGKPVKKQKVVDKDHTFTEYEHLLSSLAPRPREGQYISSCTDTPINDLSGVLGVGEDLECGVLIYSNWEEAEYLTYLTDKWSEDSSENVEDEISSQEGDEVEWEDDVEDEDDEHIEEDGVEDFEEDLFEDPEEDEEDYEDEDWEYPEEDFENSSDDVNWEDESEGEEDEEVGGWDYSEEEIIQDVDREGETYSEDTDVDLSEETTLEPTNPKKEKDTRRIDFSSLGVGGNSLTDEQTSNSDTNKTSVTQTDTNAYTSEEGDSLKNKENLPVNPIEYLKLHPRSLESEVKQLYNKKEVDRYVSRGLIQRFKGRLYI